MRGRCGVCVEGVRVRVRIVFCVKVFGVEMMGGIFGFWVFEVLR